MSDLFHAAALAADLRAGGDGLGGRIFGVVTGIVTDNQDPDGMGRVKVRFPWLSDDAASNWARRAVLMGGAEMGTWFLPELNDEVLVAFEHGDPDHPVILGSLWSGKAKPPEVVEKENNMRTIRSRSGHVVRLNDTAGGEKIEIIDKSTKNSIVFDTAANTLTLKADADITIQSATGKVLIDAKAGVEITSGADAKVDATGALALGAGGDATLKSGTALELNAGTEGTLKAGANLAVSATGNAEFKAGIKGDIEAATVLNIKGMPININ